MQPCVILKVLIYEFMDVLWDSSSLNESNCVSTVFPSRWPDLRGLLGKERARKLLFNQGVCKAMNQSGVIKEVTYLIASVIVFYLQQWKAACNRLNRNADFSKLCLCVYEEHIFIVRRSFKWPHKYKVYIQYCSK